MAPMTEYCARCCVHPGRHRAVDTTGSHPLCEYCVIALLAETQQDGRELTLVVDLPIAATASGRTP